MNAKPTPPNGYLSLFEKRCISSGPAVALSFANLDLSYNEVKNRALHIAALMRAEGVSVGSCVAVRVDRNENLLPLLLAIWSLRAAYVPVDPAFPEARQSYILNHCRADILLAKNASSLGSVFSGKILDPDTFHAHTMLDYTDERSLCPADYSPKDIAYIIYTSGSTGNPKGVAVSQGAAKNFLCSMLQQPGLSQTDTLLAVTTISFDIHVLELFLPLLAGARIILASKEQNASQAELRRLVKEYAVSIMQATPATWRLLLANGWQPRQKMKMLIGGEAFPRDLRPAMEAVASEIWNMYGPTETTVWSTCYKLEPGNDAIFIGKPIANTQCVVADENAKPLSAGSSGELLIGGDGLAEGYYRNPDLTAERFIHIGNQRFYRTGDLVRQHRDGNIEYINRVDNQIKIRGFRVEPSEIENVLSRVEGITQVVVVAATLENGDTRLVAYYLGDALSHHVLRAHCRATLPSYMVPQHFIYLLEFPLTANLKVDRKQLAAESETHIVDASEIRQEDTTRDDLDRALIAVWENVLGLQGVQIDDNFFDLGGHSLLAMQVVDEMQRVSGLEFELPVLFSNPTIRSAREALNHSKTRSASVVKLNQASGNDPVFCLCGVMIYSELASRFQNTRPVFGIFASEELKIIDAHQQHNAADFSFDELTNAYVRAIQRQGSFKKVTLVGLSFGGLICLEVAKKLAALDVEVSNIFLLDTYVASSSYRSIRSTLRDISRNWWHSGFGSLGRKIKIYILKKFGSGDKQRQKLVSLQRDNFDAQRAQAFDRAAMTWQATQARYRTDATLIKANFTDFGFGMRALPDYNLKQFIVGHLQVKAIDTDHRSMLIGDAASKVHKIIVDAEKAISEGRHLSEIS